MRLLKNSEVCRTVGVSRVTLWRMVRDGKFPSPRVIGPMTVRWLEQEVEAWIEALPPPAKAQLIPNAKLTETEAYTIKRKNHRKRKGSRHLCTL